MGITDPITVARGDPERGLRSGSADPDAMIAELPKKNAPVGGGMDF